ncbi:MAG: ABC transporter permease [Bdellovibrionota bacterium]
MRTLLSVAFAFSIVCLICLVFGENPFLVFKIVGTSFLTSKYDLGLTLYYTTCFIFTGLAVAIPLRAGLFNIGGEGQLTIGTFVTAALGAYFSRHANEAGFHHYLLLLIVGPLTGALFGFIAGFLKAARGAHEVIVTMMLNFIAAGIASYGTLRFFQNSDSQSPETSVITAPFQFISFGETPASPAFILAILSVLAMWWLMKETVLGFDAKVIAWGGRLAARNGVPEGKVITILLTLGGFFAGAVGWAEALGNAHQFRLGFSADYGFMGIAVALLAGPRIWTLIPSAFFFAILHKGAADLDMETQVFNRDFSKILQAVFIISLSAPALWQWLKPRLKMKGAANG